MENRALYAGFASVKVTPPMGNHIPGYYHKRYSDGFLTELYLRATAFSDGENKAVIFACDAIGMKASYFDILKKKIAQRCDMSEDAIYITCTHSHTSYRITVPAEASEDDNDIFLKRLYQQFCDCAQFAFDLYTTENNVAKYRCSSKPGIKDDRDGLKSFEFLDETDGEMPT